jgi:hypothetical protein
MAGHALNPNLAAIEQRLFTVAKSWFGAGVTLRCASAAIGLLAILPDYAPTVPFVVALVAMVAELCSMRSDLVKGRADRLLRIRELSDGLGWAPDMTAVADVLAAVPRKVEATAHAAPASQFASQHPAGPARAFANLKESAWWTQQLALFMFKGTMSVVILLVVVSFVCLVISTVAVVSTPSRVAIARSVTALLVVVFSAGFAKLAFAYYVLHDRAKAAVMRVKNMRETDELAQRLIALYEYQNARSSGPLIPDAVYELLRTRFNRLWALQAEA